jgi:acyl-CoA thioesterase FadM
MMSEQSQGSPGFDLTDRAGYPHWTMITIRCRDEDQLGHVNNSVYSEWFEVARVTLTRKLSAAGPDWLVTALARMTIDFRGETTWPGEVWVGGRLLSVGNRSFRSAYAGFGTSVAWRPPTASASTSTNASVAPRHRRRRSVRPWKPSCAGRAPRDLDRDPGTGELGETLRSHTD